MLLINVVISYCIFVGFPQFYHKLRLTHESYSICDRSSLRRLYGSHPHRIISVKLKTSFQTRILFPDMKTSIVF